MWVRGIIGVVLCVVGVVWIAQGVNVLHGSGMSGHGVYAVLGAIALVVGAILLTWAWRIRNNGAA
jgi:protein-S-isoprenylcysteine O-methyltransferase Ste14